MRELPVLLVDGEPRAQSVAILEYLEETYPTPPCSRFASGPSAGASMTEVINSGINPFRTCG